MTLIKAANPTEHPVLEVIAQRWSPRAFSSRRVESLKLLQVLEAARWAASSNNEQPWRFIVATRDDPEGFAKMLSCLKESNRTWAQHAPVLMLSVARMTFSKSGGVNRYAYHDVGQAAAQLALQATALGLYLHQMGGIYPEAAAERYGLPEGFEVVAGMALGYLGDPAGLPEDGSGSLETASRDIEVVAY